MSVGAAVALLLMLLLGVRASSAIAETQPPITLSAAPWQRIPLPATDGRAIHSIAPLPSDPDTLYACVGPWLGSADPAPIGPIWLFLTRDAGAHWELLPTPSLAGSRCFVQVSATGRVMLEINRSTRFYAGNGLCAETASYLSDDGGETWRELPGVALGPADAAGAYCRYWQQQDTRFVLIAHSLAHSVAGGAVATPRTRIERSDDGGVNWQPADLGLPPDGSISAFVTGGPYASASPPGLSMVATVGRYQRTPAGLAGTLQLWGTADGRTWALLNDLHPFPSDQPAPAGIAQPHYIPVRDQLPAFDFYASAQELGADYQTAGVLPPLPIPNAASERTGILQVLGVVPDGRLFALGVSPDLGVPPLPSPGNPNPSANDYLRTSWLWIWNPGAARWSVVLSPLAAEPGQIPYACGNCWEAHLTQGTGPRMGPNARGERSSGTYVWLRDWFGTENAAYRLFVPDA